MPDHEPSDEQDAVRRLLAEVRHDEPVPPDVAARLDTLLGRLVDERTSRADDRADVVSLDTRRPRRLRLLLVAAAAAVVVGAIGLGHQLPGGQSGGSTSSSADSAAGSAAQDQQAQLPEGAPLLILTSADFEAEVRRAVAASPLAASGKAPDATDVPFDSRLGLSFLPQECAGQHLGAGDLYPATYDGRPAALVVRPPAADGSRKALLHDCTAPDLVRTTTVPAP